MEISTTKYYICGMAANRIDYIKYYTWLCKETNTEVPANLEMLPEFHLIALCNVLLKQMDVLPFSDDEPKTELN